MSAVALELLIIALLIGLNAVLAMAEMAVVSSRKARLEQRAGAGDPKARAALELADSPTRLLSTVQIGITLVGVLAGNLVLAARRWMSSRTTGATRRVAKPQRNLARVA